MRRAPSVERRAPALSSEVSQNMAANGCRAGDPQLTLDNEDDRRPSLGIRRGRRFTSRGTKRGTKSGA
jgi:hypothetical protein